MNLKDKNLIHRFEKLGDGGIGQQGGFFEFRELKTKIKRIL